MVALAVEQFGRLDVLVSNAGVLSPNGRIHNLTTEDWERAFRVNVLGAVNGIRAAVGVDAAAAVRVHHPHGLGRRPDRLVARRALLRDEGGGDRSWPRSPRSSTRRDGIRVNCVCPGTFRSAIHDGLPDEALDAIAARHPLGLGVGRRPRRAPTPILASDDSRWTTGAALVVDGGLLRAVTVVPA